MDTEMAEEEKHPHRMPSQSLSGETSSSKKTMETSAGVKLEEPGQGDVAQAHGGGGGARAGAAMSEQASEQALDSPRIDISIDVRLLHCAVAECFRPLKPPIFKCEAAGHLVCAACRERDGGHHCRRCGDRATIFSHCGEALDKFVGDARVPCPFRSYGCGVSVAYHATAAHQDACAYAPCHCAVPGCPFTAAPPRLRDHLAADHSWPLDTLPAYGKALPLRVSSSAAPLPHHRLLVVEGDERTLFALSVRACGGAASSRAVSVSVSCVRTAPAAEAGPRFTCMLWAKSPPPAGSGGVGRRLMMEADVASCAVPGGVAVEEGMALYVPPPMMNGPSKEMHLRVRIDVVDPDPAEAQRRSATSSPRIRA